MSGLQFTEVMRGHLLNRPSSFAWGAQAARAAGDALAMTLTLTIRIPDLDRFLYDPRHEAEVTGTVRALLLGGEVDVRCGRVQLLAPTVDHNRRVMRYRLLVQDAQGQAWTVLGTKEVTNNLGLDLWRDTTTLRTNLFRGDVAAEDEAHAALAGSGILRLTVGAFLRQLTTFRADGPSGLAGLAVIARFMGFFLWTLLRVSATRFGFRPLQRPQRPYALFSLQGVLGPPPATHYVETKDGLTLSLLHYERGGAGDVVLLVPGLCTSSDMFIMPEHLNLVEYLLAQGFQDVFVLDGRISARHPHNLQRHDWSVDDVALDNLAAVARIRTLVGEARKLHVVGHSLGALSVSMMLAHTGGAGIASAVVNGAGLVPHGNRFSTLKLLFGPDLFEGLLGVDYFNPRWGHQTAGKLPRLIARLISIGHTECDVPACHLLSFQWGAGRPVLYRHENLLPDTHGRIGDLFGGASFGYHRHVRDMIRAGGRAVKRTPEAPRHADLPADYLDRATAIRTPMLLVAGQENALMQDANVRFFEVLRREPAVPHELLVVPGYGHCDIFMGKDVHRDVFPRLVAFLRRHGEPPPPGGGGPPAAALPQVTA